jgi:hypothetical protein
MPVDSTSSSTAVATKPSQKASSSYEEDEQALARMGSMEMSAPMVNMDEEEEQEAAAAAAAAAQQAAQADTEDASPASTVTDTDDEDDDSLDQVPHEESEEVEINLHELGEQYQAAVVAAAPPPGLTHEEYKATTQVPVPATPEVRTVQYIGASGQSYVVPTLSDEGPGVTMAQYLSPLQRQELTPAQQPVISRYMLSPPTGEPTAMSSEIPTVRPSNLAPGSLPSQQDGSGVTIQSAAPASPGTVAAGFGSVARAAPTGLAATPAPQAVSFAPSAAPEATATPLTPMPTKRTGGSMSGGLQPLPAADNGLLTAPAPLVIQPPSPELTPSLAAKVAPLPLAPFSTDLATTAAPAAAAAAPVQRHSVLDFIPELRGRKARKIYSQNTKAVWAAQYRMKVMNVILWTTLAVILIVLLGYWMSIGSPTKLQDWPIVEQLLSK